MARILLSRPRLLAPRAHPACPPRRIPPCDRPVLRSTQCGRRCGRASLGKRRLDRLVSWRKAKAPAPARLQPWLGVPSGPESAWPGHPQWLPRLYRLFRPSLHLRSNLEGRRPPLALSGMSTLEGLSPPERAVHHSRMPSAAGESPTIYLPRGHLHSPSVPPLALLMPCPCKTHLLLNQARRSKTGHGGSEIIQPRPQSRGQGYHRINAPLLQMPMMQYGERARRTRPKFGGSQSEIYPVELLAAAQRAALSWAGQLNLDAKLNC